VFTSTQLQVHGFLSLYHSQKDHHSPSCMISCSCTSCSSSSSSRAYTSVYRVHDQAYKQDSSIRPTPRRSRDTKSRKLTLRRLRNVNKKLSGKIKRKQNPRSRRHHSSSLQAILLVKAASVLFAFLLQVQLHQQKQQRMFSFQ
jgi:hypothetical protein